MLIPCKGRRIQRNSVRAPSHAQTPGTQADTRLRGCRQRASVCALRVLATLLDAGQVDAVEVTVVPVLLGSGVPLVAPTSSRAALRLTHSHVYPSGMVALHYDVPGAAGQAGR